MKNTERVDAEDAPRIPEKPEKKSRISRAFEKLEKKLEQDPIECPRGWGSVSFTRSFGSSMWESLPFFGVESTCPIGGVSTCSECSYDVKPDTFKLAEQLRELKVLRSEDAISENEYLALRESLVYLHRAGDGEDWRKTAAWVMGPFGTLVASSGAALALAFHPAWWALCLLGSIVAVLGLSFWGLSKGNSELNVEDHL